MIGEYGPVLRKTLFLGLVMSVPAAAGGWLLGGSAIALGIVAGSAIAMGNIAASLLILAFVADKSAAVSLAVVLSGFFNRLLLIGVVFYLISGLQQINIFTVAVTLVVEYTVFAFAEFWFSTPARRTLV